MELFTAYRTHPEWSGAWEGPPVRSRAWLWRERPEHSRFQEIAHYVGGALSVSGFQLFQNGGLPLIERRAGPYRQEILLCPAPNLDRRPEAPFAVKVHLSSSAVAEVRSVYWAPPTRAPHWVASGDLGQLAAEPEFILWHGQGRVETATKILERVHRDVLPWFEIFTRPAQLRERIYTRSLKLVDDCTSLELLLAEFDPFEARSFVALRMHEVLSHTGPVGLAEGFDLNEERAHSAAAYYKLR